MPRSPRPSRLSASLTLLSLLTLTSCAHQAPTVATSAPPPATGCTAFPRISYSRKTDSDETIIEVKRYLAARDALCGVGK